MPVLLLDYSASSTSSFCLLLLLLALVELLGLISMALLLCLTLWLCLLLLLIARLICRLDFRFVCYLFLSLLHLLRHGFRCRSRSISLCPGRLRDRLSRELILIEKKRHENIRTEFLRFVIWVKIRAFKRIFRKFWYRIKQIVELKNYLKLLKLKRTKVWKMT